MRRSIMLAVLLLLAPNLRADEDACRKDLEHQSPTPPGRSLPERWQAAILDTDPRRDKRSRHDPRQKTNHPPNPRASPEPQHAHANSQNNLLQPPSKKGYRRSVAPQLEKGDGRASYGLALDSPLTPGPSPQRGEGR